MRTSMTEIQKLLESKIQCIWINTYEEVEVLKDLKEVINKSKKLHSLELFSWSHTSGLQKEVLLKNETPEPIDSKMKVPSKLFNFIQERQQDHGKNQQGIFILHDLHLLIDSHEIKRLIRDTKENSAKVVYNPIVVISPVVTIPSELEKLFTIVDYETPSYDEVKLMVDVMTKKFQQSNQKGSNFYIPDDEEKDQLIKACMGLTTREILDTFAKSLTNYDGLTLQAVLNEKMQLVRKSGVLSYKIPEANFDDIGGNNAFKDWVEEVQASYTPDAIEFGLERPKGYLAVGIPGTSKSYAAEALAGKMGVPFLQLQMSKIMDKLVGQSERKIEQALRVAEACQPCVLLIDEVEKALGGISSSNSSDSGTLSRVFEQVLQFLQKDNGVFTIMTSNDVTQLPPELTRSGRLDARWYFSLPTEEERRQIYSIHLSKTGRSISEELLEAAVQSSENFTGAEIKDSVKIAMRKAFKRFKEDGNRELTIEDIELANRDVVPIYNSSRERILALESWAKDRARFTTQADTNSINNVADDDDLMNTIMSLQ